MTVTFTTPFASVYRPPRSQVSVLLKTTVLYLPYGPVALAGGNTGSSQMACDWNTQGLAVLDLDESAIRWGVGGSIHGSEIHKFYFPLLW